MLRVLAVLAVLTVLASVEWKRKADLPLIDLADEKGVRRVSGVPLPDPTPSLDGLEPKNPRVEDILTC